MSKSLLLAAACAACCLAAGAAHAESRRVALLVGVSQYEIGQTYPDLNLEGPVHDVAALRDVLVRRWGFEAQDVHTLVDAQATRAAILSELQALEQRSSAGDEVLIYFSGHGLSALSGSSNVPVPHGSGAFAPYDMHPDATKSRVPPIVGRTDLRPRIGALERGGRSLWVISDSCYSGQQVRSVQLPSSGNLPARLMPIQTSSDRYDRARVDPTWSGPEPYPYRNTVYLSAAAEGEIAHDIGKNQLRGLVTLDNKPHGAMTDALLRVLEGRLPADFNRDGYLDLAEVHRAVSDFMATRAYGQSPQRLPGVADDAHGLGARPVLRVRGAAATAAGGSTAQPLVVRAEGLPAGLQQAVSAVPGVRMARDANDALDVALIVGKGKVELVSAAGDAVAAVSMAESARVTAQLRQLAWAKQLRSLAEQHRRAVLPMEIAPSTFGGNFLLGQKLAFVVKADRAGSLLLLNVDADGKVSVLYPARPSELTALPPTKATHVPGEAPHDLIEVRPPLGMDVQFGFVFDETPSGLEALVGLTGADPSDPRLLALQRMLPAMAGRYTFASTELRTLDKP